jgi:Ca2+-binding RTX toxin-like protein
MGFTTVTYNVTDGTTSAADSAIVNFLPRLPILGTDGKDTLLGTDCGDNISAGADDDTIRGQAGDDVIYGGSGDDTIYGDAGNDVIYGGDGNDTLYGGDGNDTIFGGNGDDTIYGGAGNNYLLGGAGNDLIYTGDGNSTVIGGSGRDWIFDGAGSDKIFGGIGNDTVFATMGGGVSYYDGGAGVNKLNYATYTGSLDINLNTGFATGTGPKAGVDSFTNFQVIQGGTGGTVFHAKVIAAPPAAHVDVPSSSGDLHELSPQVSLPCPTNGDAETSETTVQVTTDSSSGDNLQHDHTPMVDLPAPEHIDVSCVVTTLPDAAVNQGYTYLGGAGTDVLDYSPAQQSLTIDVVHGMARGAEIDTDYFSSIESFTSGAGDDTFIAAGQGTAHHMTTTDAPEELDLTAGPVLASNAPGNANLLVLDDASGDAVKGAAVDQHFDGGAGFDTLNYSKAEHALDINLTDATATGDDIGHDTFANIEHFVGGAGDDHFTVGSGTYVLEGGGGGDLFTFAAPNAGSEIHAEIRGFEVGDLIQMSKYDIYEQPANAENDQFQAIYADNQDDNPGATTQDAVAPIRVRYETIHDLHKTYVETDLDDSGVYHTIAEIDGCHQLVINNHIV